MSESTQELAAAVQGLGESLGGAATSARRLSEWAAELSDEAAGHGWYALAGRMQHVGDALDVAVVSLETGQNSCRSAVTELGLINDENSAEDVAGHLTTSSNQLTEAATEAGEALVKIEEAQEAAAEVGQQGMMKGTTDLFEMVTELHARAGAQQRASAGEQAQADAYAERQGEKLTSDGESAPARPSPGRTEPQRSADGLVPDPWSDPQARRDWVIQMLNDPRQSRSAAGSEPWADYQRQVAGDREVRIGGESSGDEDRRIWADGLCLDPDTVVAAEAKYVSKPGRSLYEGGAPPALEDNLLSGFDLEMERYAEAIRDPLNPIGRLRIIASTQTAANFLEARARRILGPNIDLQARHVSPKGQS